MLQAFIWLNALKLLVRYLASLKLHRNFLGGKSISAAATTWNLDESSNDLYSFELLLSMYVEVEKSKF